MDWKDIDKDYIDLIMEDKDRYLKDYNQRVSKEVASSKAIYKGKVVPYSYKPLFYTEEDVENFKKIGSTMLKIGDKVADEYIRNENFRKKFDFPKEIEELILIDSGYDINVPMARLDIFYNSLEDFKFCELNTDGASAMNEDDIFTDITLNSQAIRDLGNRYEFTRFENIYSWVDKSIEIYNSWDKKIVDKPNVAILDLVESATTVEFERFKSAYEERGYETRIVDPRRLVYRDGNLYDGDFRIDLVYRRLVTSEIIPYLEEVEEFLSAYRDGAVCVIGSFRSQIIHNKIIFKVLHDEEMKDILSKEDLEFIKNHIPLTKEFKGEIETFNHVKDNKNRYIMKPSDMNAGQGVYVGRDMDQEEWERRLKDSWDKDYIYQEFVEPYYRDFIEFNGGVKPVKYNSVLGLYMYGGEFNGLYTRVGSENVISSQVSPRAANLIAYKKD